MPAKAFPRARNQDDFLPFPHQEYARRAQWLLDKIYDPGLDESFSQQMASFESLIKANNPEFDWDVYAIIFGQSNVTLTRGSTAFNQDIIAPTSSVTGEKKDFLPGLYTDDKNIAAYAWLMIVTSPYINGFSHDVQSMREAEGSFVKDVLDFRCPKPVLFVPLHHTSSHECSWNGAHAEITPRELLPKISGDLLSPKNPDFHALVGQISAPVTPSYAGTFTGAPSVPDSYS